MAEATSFQKVYRGMDYTVCKKFPESNSSGWTYRIHGYDHLGRRCTALDLTPGSGCFYDCEGTGETGADLAEQIVIKRIDRILDEVDPVKEIPKYGTRD